MSFDEMMYEQEVEQRSLSEEEYAAVQRRLAAEREAESRRRQQEEAAAARRLAAERRHLAMRPLGERLVEAHCGSCHTLEPVAAARHSRPGWHFTVARMRYWHGAAVPLSEHRTIVNHLALSQPAAAGRTVAEYSVLGLSVALPAAFWFPRRRRRSK